MTHYEPSAASKAYTKRTDFEQVWDVLHSLECAIERLAGDLRPGGATIPGRNADRFALLYLQNKAIEAKKLLKNLKPEDET